MGDGFYTSKDSTTSGHKTNEKYTDFTRTKHNPGKANNTKN